MPPTGIEAVLGKKQFGSQPGVEEPSTFVTIIDVSSKTTVTVKLAVPTFPAKSVAVQVTVVVPKGNNAFAVQPAQ